MPHINIKSLIRNALPRQWITRAATVAAIPALAAGVALLGAGAPAAQASVRPDYSSYIYTQSGRPHALATCYLACGSTGRPIYPANGTGAGMICWADEGSYDGNYTSKRWFVVNISGQGGEWWIHSSYVYYQTSVPEC
jgi:hypothetical protein